MLRLPFRGCILFWLLILHLGSGCSLRDAKLKKELTGVLADLPEPPHSVLLSESESHTGGADSRCDGYMVSRLYGTDQPMDSITASMESWVLQHPVWSVDPGGPSGQAMIALVREDGYGLAVNAVRLRPELLRDPFFLHKQVQVDQPYRTIYLLNIVHIDASQVEHCWGK